MDRYLAASEVIDWDNFLVMEKAKFLSQGLHHPVTISFSNYA